jgi:hypothetical protein
MLHLNYVDLLILASSGLFFLLRQCPPFCGCSSRPRSGILDGKHLSIVADVVDHVGEGKEESWSACAANSELHRNRGARACYDLLRASELVQEKQGLNLSGEGGGWRSRRLAFVAPVATFGNDQTAGSHAYNVYGTGLGLAFAGGWGGGGWRGELLRSGVQVGEGGPELLLVVWGEGGSEFDFLGPVKIGCRPLA